MAIKGRRTKILLSLYMLSGVEFSNVSLDEKTQKIFDLSFKSAKIPVKIANLTKKREICRESKQFIQSDALRKEIEMLYCYAIL